MFFYILTNTRWIPLFLILSLLSVYSLMPSLVNLFLLSNPYFIQLSLITLVACLFITIGYFTPLMDSRFSPNARHIIIRPKFFHVIVWFFFIVFLFFTLYTASSIPILSALNGNSATELSEERGAFLKARTGAEALLIYISTVFVSALLPYSLAILFIEKNRFRYLLLFIFFIYSISFLQKALFINVFIPLFYLVANKKRFGLTRTILGIITIAGFLYILTFLAAGSNEASAEINLDGLSSGEFYSAAYLPKNSIDHLVWRIVSVPMFSASDTLLIFDTDFKGEYLWGATSSLFSFLFSLDRVNLEKLVFEYQWGWNDIANSNAVYFADAFVNFGWVGVFLFSAFIGQALRWFRKSRDQAFKALCLIFCLNIFSGSLIGTLFSNGYLLLFFIALFVKVTYKPKMK